MTDEAIKGIAQRFVRLILLKHDRWGRTVELTSDEMNIISAVISITEFGQGGKEIVAEKIAGFPYKKKGEEKLGSVSNLCPVKVVDREGKDDREATGWLGELFSRAIIDLKRYGEEKTVIEVTKKIEQSIPFAQSSKET